MTPKKAEDRSSKYPKPPYTSQSQPWPGSASKMDPRPDHGETSYKGSGHFSGPARRFITGGDSEWDALPLSPMPVKAPM